MARMMDLDVAIREAGIPLSGVNGDGPGAKINFGPDATPAQKKLARDMLAAFDWTEKATPTKAEVRTAVAAMTDARRQALFAEAVAEMIVRFGLRVDLTTADAPVTPAAG